MRLGHKGQIIIEDSQLIGINLGADYVAEHEWGIKELRRDFGITEEYVKDKLGFEATKIQTISKKFGLFEGKNKSNGAGYGRYYESDKNDATNFFYNENKKFNTYEKALKEMEYKLFNSRQPEEIAGCWDGSSFAFLMVDKHKKYYDDLIKAFENKNISISLGANRVFENGGLNFLIYDKIPKQIFEDAINTHLSSNRLKKAVEKSGLFEKLKNAGLSWYALSPRWVDKAEKEIQYWLNPQDQHIYNYGWYKEKELLEWAKGRGPIIKRKENGTR